MKRTISIFILLFFGILNCFSQDDIESKLGNTTKVSIEKLISQQKKFDKKHVLVCGYPKFEKGVSRIFISKEDFEKNNTTNSVCFQYFIESSTYPTVERCDGKYCKLSGVYISGKKLGAKKEWKMENGIISDVRSVILVNEK